ncbi:hypothetical protein TeGR_g13080 [Tetraparma gracilis]|uniref:Uncharacterized protein n=1 Tax=Tetraparma gracilis TaxID=2962635 RepID=A0ABQ6MVJ1_9STRA|nr:hypothetical protein TeGR_g13080 [Tetraparma gracilis]
MHLLQLILLFLLPASLSLSAPSSAAPILVDLPLLFPPTLLPTLVLKALPTLYDIDPPPSPLIPNLSRKLGKVLPYLSDVSLLAPVARSSLEESLVSMTTDRSGRGSRPLTSGEIVASLDLLLPTLSARFPPISPASFSSAIAAEFSSSPDALLPLPLSTSLLVPPPFSSLSSLPLPHPVAPSPPPAPSLTFLASLPPSSLPPGRCYIVADRATQADLVAAFELGVDECTQTEMLQICAGHGLLDG